MLRVLIGALCFATATISTACAGERLALATVKLCDRAPWTEDAICRTADIRNADPQDGPVWIDAEVRLQERLASPAVFVSALASTAVWWDGRFAGANGRPSPDPDAEKPGLRDAVIALPVDAGEPGTHRLTLWMSSGRLPLSVPRPVHGVSIGERRDPADVMLEAYLPALGTAGVLLAAAVYFGALGSRFPGAGRLSAAALFAIAQLCAETVRAFVSYPYPLQVVRVAAVLLFAVAFGAALVSFFFRRYAPERERALLVVYMVAAALAVTAPGFDGKTQVSIAAAFGLAAVAAAEGVRRRIPDAKLMLAAIATAALLLCASGPKLLDGAFYLLTTGLMLALLAVEARRFRRERESRLKADERLRDLARRPERDTRVRLALGAGAEKSMVYADEVVRLAAADDYTEVHLANGRVLLHPAPMSELLERLPSSFMRVHRSHAVDERRVRAWTRTRGALFAEIGDGARIPVSRRRARRVLGERDAEIEATAG